MVVFFWWCGGVFVVTGGVVVFLWWCLCGGVFVLVWWCFCVCVFVVVVVFLRCFCDGVFVYFFLVKSRFSSHYREVMERVLIILV